MSAIADETESAVLVVERLTSGYRQGEKLHPSLLGLDLRVGAGEFVAIVGESGSGKSTLANAVLGLLPDTAVVAGRIAVRGVPILGRSEDRLARLRGRLMGAVPQDPAGSLNPVLTIFDQVREVFLLRGERLTRAEQVSRVRALLELAEIDAPDLRMRQYPHELSGGLKQRVLIAIAFGLDPTLLVADEPTSALDVTVQRQVMEVFSRLARERRSTVLFVTHDIALATDYADRIVVMRDGRIVEDRTVDELGDAELHPYTSELLRDSSTTVRQRPAFAQGPLSAADDVIRFDRVGKDYADGPLRSTTVLDEVSFDVVRGSTTAIVGESGAGKSTLAKILLGIVPPTRGTVSLFGRDVGGIRGRARSAHWRDVQMVFQNPDSALDPRATVRGIVEEPLRARGGRTSAQRRELVHRAIARVGLDPQVLTRVPSQLSGGQRQRVAIARAVVAGSPVLVLDEPLSALDVVTRRQVLGLLDELQAELGLTYVFISHDLSTVRRIADQVVVMRRGRLIEHGPVDRVFSDPQAEYTRRLIEAAPGRRLAGSTPTSDIRGSNNDVTH